MGNCFQDAYSSMLKSVLLNIAPFHDTDVLTICFFLNFRMDLWS